MLYCEIEGPADAPAIVFGHALGASRRLWRAQVDALSDRYRVLTFDMRGHGESFAPPGEYQIAELGQDVIDLLDYHKIAKASYCGISMGGLVGQWLGIHAAERLERLILCNTAARIGTVASWNERITLIRLHGLAEIAQATMERWFTVDFRERNPQTVQVVRGDFEHTPLVGYLGCCAAIRDANFRGFLSAIRVPTLIITGAADLTTGEAEAIYLASRIPGSTRLLLPTAHLANLGSPRQFNQAMERFLLPLMLS